MLVLMTLEIVADFKFQSDAEGTHNGLTEDHHQSRLHKL